jgi:hypothetical protein
MLVQLPLGSDDPSPGPLASMGEVERVPKILGAKVDISLSPYNPETDAVVDRSQQRLNAEDLEWERKRGSKEYDDWLAEQRKKVDWREAGDYKEGDVKEGGKASSGRKLRF